MAINKQYTPMSSVGQLARLGGMGKRQSEQDRMAFEWARDQQRYAFQGQQSGYDRALRAGLMQQGIENQRFMQQAAFGQQDVRDANRQQNNLEIQENQFEQQDWAREDEQEWREEQSARDATEAKELQRQVHEGQIGVTELNAMRGYGLLQEKHIDAMKKAGYTYSEEQTERMKPIQAEIKSYQDDSVLTPEQRAMKINPLREQLLEVPEVKPENKPGDEVIGPGGYGYTTDSNGNPIPMPWQKVKDDDYKDYSDSRRSVASTLATTEITDYREVDGTDSNGRPNKKQEAFKRLRTPEEYKRDLDNWDLYNPKPGPPQSGATVNPETGAWVEPQEVSIDPATGAVTTGQPASPEGGGGAEAGFQEWYADVAHSYNQDPNPDAAEHFYDWRSAHEEGATADENDHWPSKYKKVGHPDQFVDGKNTITGKNYTTEDVNAWLRAREGAIRGGATLRPEGGGGAGINYAELQGKKFSDMPKGTKLRNVGPNQYVPDPEGEWEITGHSEKGTELQKPQQEEASQAEASPIVSKEVASQAIPVEQFKGDARPEDGQYVRKQTVQSGKFMVQFYLYHAETDDYELVGMAPPEEAEKAKAAVAPKEREKKSATSIFTNFTGPMGTY